MSDPHSVPQNITIHDMTRQQWGHGISIWTKRSTDGTRWKILGHSKDRIQEGDRMMVEGQSNALPICYQVTSIQYKIDPRDMFEADIEFVPGGRCGKCKIWFAADDPRVANGTCPICAKNNL